ncbi:MAG TPA: transposase [Thermoanaerobaculia bacterium]
MPRFRLADSLPQGVLRPWQVARQRWLDAHPGPWDDATEAEFFRLFTAKFHEYLDAGYGSCVLRLPEVNEVVATAIRFFDDERYRLDRWCIAPNHVHAVVTPLGDHELSRILHSWKSYSAHEIAKMPRAVKALGPRFVHRI